MTNEATERIPFGVSFLDQMIPDGQRPGHLQAIIGTTGVGKTTMLQMLASAGCRRDFFNGISGVWLFFTVEEGRDAIFRRMLSATGLISRELVESGQQLRDEHGQVADYETELKRQLEVTSLAGRSELERRNIGLLILQRMLIIDLNQSSFSLHSSALVGALANRFRTAANTFAQAGIPVRGIYIDNLKLLIDRSLCEEQFGMIRFHRSAFSGVLDALKELSCEFRCPAWITHHVDEAEALQGAVQIQHHQDAVLLPRFGDHFRTILSLGTRDLATGRFQVACTKTPSLTMPTPCIAKFSTAVNIIEEATDCRIDRSSGTIVETETMSFTLLRHGRATDRRACVG